MEKFGADINCKDSFDRLPIMGAVQIQSRTEVIDFLLERGASLEDHTCYGENLLHLAAKNPSSEILEYLVQKLLPAHSEYLEEYEFRNGCTPLAFAQIRGLKKNQRVLIRAGASKKNAKHRDRFFYEPNPDNESVKDIVYARWKNDDFTWTPENKQKIISVIQGIDKRVNQMYDAVLKTKLFIEQNQEIPDDVKKDFRIVARMEYVASGPLPTADEETLDRLYDATNWNALPSVFYDSDSKIGMQSRDQALYLGLNWDIELFDRPELEHVKVPYYVHALFVDDSTYTLSDMMYMKSEDFKFFVEVSFDGDAIL